MPYAYCLASCSVGSRLSLGVLLVSGCLLMFPLVLPVYCYSALLFELLWPLSFRVFALYPVIACLGYVHHRVACLASQASYWAGALWDGLSGL